MKKKISPPVKTVMAAVLLLTLPLFSAAAEARRIILLETMPVPAVLNHSRWFIEEMELIGRQEGMDLEITVLNAEGDRGVARRLLEAELKKGRPDLVVTNATLATQTAQAVLTGTEIPILFMTVSDPVGAGIIKTVGIPTGTNVTGRVFTIPREVKINIVLQLVGQIHPGTEPRFGFVHSDYPSSMGDARELKKAADAAGGLRFMDHTISYRKVPEGLDAMLKDVSEAVSLLENRIDYWWEPSGPLGETREYTDLLLSESSRPVIFGNKLDSVKAGALVHLTPDMEKSGREVARLARQILRGTDPGTIPPIPPDSFTLGVNLTTALKLNIVIPPEILDLAGENVFR